MAAVRGADPTPLRGDEVKSALTDDAAFLDELTVEAKSETRIPEFLQIMLNMTPLFVSVFVKVLRGDVAVYTHKDLSACLATIEPHSLYRWKKDATKFRIAWMYQADDLPSFFALVKADASLRYLLYCLLTDANKYFEVDPDTKLAESKKNEWRNIVRQFEVRFEAKAIVKASSTGK